jgi:hypothetical protein
MHDITGMASLLMCRKLVFLPKQQQRQQQQEASQQQQQQQECCIARPEWGPPTPVGSAAKAHALVQQLARKRKASEPAADDP